MPSEHQKPHSKIRSFAWRGACASIKSRGKRAKSILHDNHGLVRAGELLAIMGPSGSGKSTLLHVLSHRANSTGMTVDREVFINGTTCGGSVVRQVSAYVGQKDALMGSLTVSEHLAFSAKLSYVPMAQCEDRVGHVMADFGLSSLADRRIETMAGNGISAGQKRRVSIASQMLSKPHILFLDEPTSGLDYATAFEVMASIKAKACKEGMIVIAAIHQPSASVTEMFDSVLVLSRGETVYFGRTDDARHIGPRVDSLPPTVSTAESLVRYANDDSGRTGDERHRVATQRWKASSLAMHLSCDIEKEQSRVAFGDDMHVIVVEHRVISTLVILLHRALLKAYRDPVAYHVRSAMYLGLAFLMGTVWLRLPTTEQNIQAFINAIFFGGAFLSFMAVAYIPAYLEDRALFMKERTNGSYGPGAFLLCNFFAGIPYLSLMALLFSLVVYWMCNFRPDANAFCAWVFWLLLDVIAAESLVVLVSSLQPIPVVALAATAFLNGLWMCMGGFLVPIGSLNPVWRYLFHYIDYQSYVFQGMMVSQFTNRNYTCTTGENCTISGISVLEGYGYADSGAYSGVAQMVAIICVLRMLCWISLQYRRT